MSWIEPPVMINHLDVSALEPGGVYRFWVELVHDGLGEPVCVPVIVVKGRRPGMTMGLVSTLHGNEVNGIRVVHELVDKIDTKTLRGTIVAVVVANTPSYLRHQRVYVDGQDLNHLMPGREDGRESEVYAYRLVDRIINQFDLLLDLHTASFGRINSFYIRADMDHEQTARMAYLLRPQIILHNPPSDGTLRGVASEMGISALTVEIGNPQVFQPELIRRTLVGIRAIMGEFSMTARRTIASGAPPRLCGASRWIYTPMGGILEIFVNVSDDIVKDQPIAHIRNIFGDVMQEVLAPDDGIVIGMSTNPVAASGARILHLGTLEDASRFSQREQIGSLKFK